MKNTAKIITLFLSLVIASFLFSAKALAQVTLPLSVVPPKQEMLINPGENFSTTIKFQNLGTAPVSGTLSVLDFIVTDNQGTPVFIDNPQVVGTTTIAAKYSAAKWVKLYADRMTIGANDNVSVPVTINVPKNAAPGGRYAAVIFEPSGSLTLNANTSGGETPVSIRIASLLYIRVAGPITENATVSKFTAPSFLEYGPVTIATEITNMGDYHITPQGTVTLKDSLGNTVATQNLDTKNVFPGTARGYTNQMGGKLMIGKFTANLSAIYGDHGKTLSSTLTLWIFPWRLALAVVLGIIVIILLITLWMKRVTGKEKKLTEELKEEKTELETLKEQLKDVVTTGEVKPKEETEAPKEKTA